MQSFGAQRLDRRLLTIGYNEGDLGPGTEALQGHGQLLAALLNRRRFDDPTLLVVEQSRDVQDVDTAVTATGLE
jgi:hypothetical protein